jgi:UTP--glucose-1-phosphate uridylyltransferase
MPIQVRKAVFPVGGLGTRFLPATKAMPKEMLPVVDKPLIQYAVEEAKAAGITEFILVTGRDKTVVEDHFDVSYELERWLEERGKRDQLASLREGAFGPGQVAYTRQQTPLGLGHAIWCARHLVGRETFAVILADDLILGDTPCLKQMVDAHATVGGNLLAAMEVASEHTSRYGIVTPGAESGRLTEVKGLVEKPDPKNAPSRLAVIGRYILEPTVFDELGKGERGAGGEIQLTDGMAKLIGRSPFHAYRFAGTRFDCGDKAGFLEANLAFALAREDMRGPVAQFLRKYVTP